MGRFCFELTLTVRFDSSIPAISSSTLSLGRPPLFSSTAKAPIKVTAWWFTTNKPAKYSTS
jgi:hypothetical protein